MKKKTGLLLRMAFLATCLSAMFMMNAQAYLDPAATSYIVQIISGVVIACGVTVGIFWKKIRLFFRKMRMKSLEKKLAKKSGADSAQKHRYESKRIKKEGASAPSFLFENLQTRYLFVLPGGILRIAISHYYIKEVNHMANRIMLNETSYFGKGAIQEIAGEIKSRGCRKVMVCTDPDLLKFQVATKVTDVLDTAGIAYAVYDGIKANPTIENVQEGVAFCRKEDADLIVAVGGGSAIDTSKAIAVIATNPEFADVRSLEGVAPTKNKCLPIIAVSTTSGTGAEVTINYVITDVERHRKFVCVDPHDIPVVAVIDPDMVASMPRGLCAATGMDALTHAIEGYITKAAWELTDMLHIKAIA